MNKPSEIATLTVQSSFEKANRNIFSTILLSFQAGAFIAFAGFGSSVVMLNVIEGASLYGINKFLSGVVFTVGLMMVLIAGGELFTGNSLMSVGLLQKKVTLKQVTKNWTVVYIANFLGAVFITFLIFASDAFPAFSSQFLLNTVNTAYNKLNMTFFQAFIRGVLCNFLVCIAVWMAASAKDIAGKILAIFFPIFLFVISGFEHCIANMYYIPAGMLAVPKLAEQGVFHMYSAEQLASINLPNMLMKNFLPTTLGNIVGGAILVGSLYWFVYLKNQKD